jgi:hypothetical protein
VPAGESAAWPARLWRCCVSAAGPYERWRTATDDPADALRALGADVIVGDLARPADVATALESVQRMFFSMSLAPSYLEATATVATVARAVGGLDALVAISQMTVSQMDALSMSESHHQRLHWLSEQGCLTGLGFRSYTFARRREAGQGLATTSRRSPTR